MSILSITSKACAGGSEPTEQNVNAQDRSVAMMIVIDVSSSMLSEDFKPNRIEAAKSVVFKLIDNNVSDSIGLTIFAGETITECPLTGNHDLLQKSLKNISCKKVQEGLMADGTAIGMGIANAIKQLEASNAQERLIILFTDGSNNKGEISPLTAAQMAKERGIKIHAVAIGTNGEAPFPMPTAKGIQYVNIPVEIDSQTLSKIASITNANFFRVHNSAELSNLHNEF